MQFLFRGGFKSPPYGRVKPTCGMVIVVNHTHCDRIRVKTHSEIFFSVAGMRVGLKKVEFSTFGFGTPLYVKKIK